jgi:hypothetical protein
MMRFALPIIFVMMVGSIFSMLVLRSPDKTAQDVLTTDEKGTPVATTP